MKSNRNRRVEAKRKSTVHTAPAFAVPRLPAISLRESSRRLATSLLDQLSSRPKQIMEMLEQDAAIQAERLARLEEAFMLPLMQPQPVFVPVPSDLPEPPMVTDDEGPYAETAFEESPVVPTHDDATIAVSVAEPDDQPVAVVPVRVAGRRDYSRSLPPSRVVRRRIV
jgi:hypothetical protein